MFVFVLFVYRHIELFGGLSLVYLTLREKNLGKIIFDFLRYTPKKFCGEVCHP